MGARLTPSGLYTESRRIDQQAFNSLSITNSDALLGWPKNTNELRQKVKVNHQLDPDDIVGVKIFPHALPSIYQAF